MFIREKETKNKATGKKYKKHVLVESVRTEKGPRQRIVMELGTLKIPKPKWKELAYCLETKLSGQITFIEGAPEVELAAAEAMEQYSFLLRKKREKNERQKQQKLVNVDLNTTTTSQSRSLGAELVVNKIWKQLNLTKILKEKGFTAKEQALAEAVIAGRLIDPGSDLDTWRWIHQRSAVKEMLGVNLDGVGKDAVYEIADQLLLHKEDIEDILYKEVRKNFGEENVIYIYDLTNTYFEGQCQGNTLASNGNSKEKRSDCPLVSLALVVDSNGFPVFSQVYEGNQSEPKTLEYILAKLDKDTPALLKGFKPTMVMDRGIATAENISYLEEKGYPYAVIERRSTENDYLEEYKNLETFTKMNSEKENEEIYVKKIIEDNKCKVLCLSQKKRAKEESMDKLKEGRFSDDMQRLSLSISKGSIKRKEKIWERVGRIRERYPTIAKYYEIKMLTDSGNRDVAEIKWDKKQTRNERESLTGCYVIETTHDELPAHEIWNLYMTILRVEEAFKCLKFELGLRPVHHQLARRTEGHFFISVLAYCILNTIEYQLKEKGERRRWSSIRKSLSTHNRSTVMITDDEDNIHHIRVNGTPEKDHQEIYNKLDVSVKLKRHHSVVGTRL